MVQLHKIYTESGKPSQVNALHMIIGHLKKPKKNSLQIQDLLPYSKGWMFRFRCLILYTSFLLISFKGCKLIIAGDCKLRAFCISCLKKDLLLLLLDLCPEVSRSVLFNSTCALQDVQRSGRPGNVREFRCNGKSQGNVRECLKSKESQGILWCEIHFQPM